MKQKRNKRSEGLKNKKRGMGKILIISIIAFVLLLGIILISALTTEEQNALVNELNSLEGNLNENGYGWLVNYSINYSEINETTNDTQQTSYSSLGEKLKGVLLKRIFIY